MPLVLPWAPGGSLVLERDLEGRCRERLGPCRRFTPVTGHLRLHKHFTSVAGVCQLSFLTRRSSSRSFGLSDGLEGVAGSRQRKPLRRQGRGPSRPRAEFPLEQKAKTIQRSDLFPNRPPEPQACCVPPNVS